MQTLNLSICGSDRTKASFEDVLAVETPQKTETWTPVSHGFLIDQTKKKLDENGFDVVDENHNLARFGQRYFGLMQVQDRSAPENPDRATVVGLRNGHDKCFPAGIMAGDAPFVCSNLIFNNEIVIARRHTKNIDNVNVSIRNMIFPQLLRLMILSLGHSKMVLAPKLKLLILSDNGISQTITSFRIGICTLFIIHSARFGRVISDCFPIAQLNCTPYSIRLRRFNPSNH